MSSVYSVRARFESGTKRERRLRYDIEQEDALGGGEGNVCSSVDSSYSTSTSSNDLFEESLA